MEVMAVNSPWQSYMIFHDPFQRYHPLFPTPFKPSIAYGSIAGDSEAYLAHSVAPYAALDQAQQPSWFPYLRLEHLAGAARNYSDGLVPIWSSAIPGSYKIAPVCHSDYPGDPDTEDYLLQWLNSANLPQGAYLNTQWNTSVTSYLGRTWTTQLEEMAPHTQNMLYVQSGGIGRINPAALQGNNAVKPVIKIARAGLPDFSTGLSFVLSITNSGTPVHNFAITGISFYQSLVGPKLPYFVAKPPTIDFLGPPQNVPVSVTSLSGFSSGPINCTVNYQFLDQNETLTTGTTSSIRLR
jgi:hypothetical protein